MDIVSEIIAFEAGELDNQGVIELFSKLISSGMAWTLQGSYGRAAHSLIERGYLNPDGSFGPTLVNALEE